MNNDLISREALKANMKKAEEQADTFEMLVEFYEQIIDNAPTVDLWQMRQEATENALKKAEALYERPQGECRTCRHRDPEDKKCDCGKLERAGCLFPVSDDYYCKFYEKGGAE